MQVRLVSILYNSTQCIRKCGVDVLEIGPRDVSDLFPLCRTDDVLAGFYVKVGRRSNSALPVLMMLLYDSSSSY